MSYPKALVLIWKDTEILVWTLYWEKKVGSMWREWLIHRLLYCAKVSPLALNLYDAPVNSRLILHLMKRQHCNIEQSKVPTVIQLCQVCLILPPDVCNIMRFSIVLQGGQRDLQQPAEGTWGSAQEVPLWQEHFSGEPGGAPQGARGMTQQRRCHRAQMTKPFRNLLIIPLKMSTPAAWTKSSIVPSYGLNVLLIFLLWLICLVISRGRGRRLWKTKGRFSIWSAARGILWGWNPETLKRRAAAPLSSKPCVTSNKTRSLFDDYATTSNSHTPTVKHTC